MVIQSVVGQHIGERTNGTGFWITGAVHHTSDTGIDQRACTHEARLQRDVQRAVHETPVANDVGGVANGENLGVGRGISAEFPFIVTTDDDRSIANDHRSNRDVIVVHRCASLGQRQPHRLLVGHMSSVTAASFGPVTRLDLTILDPFLNQLVRRTTGMS